MSFIVIHQYWINGGCSLFKKEFKNYQTALKHFNNVKNGVTDYHMEVRLYNIKNDNYSFIYRNH